MPASHNPEPGEDCVDIELSAHDLLELSTPVSAQQSSAASGQGNGATFAAEFPAGKLVAADRKAVATRTRNTPRMAMVIGGIFALIAVGTVVRYRSAPTDESSQSPSVAQVESPSSQDEAEAVPQEAPVRITNSFDKSEVFEFPPGTSESEARAAVADLLLKRAAERMN